MTAETGAAGLAPGTGGMTCPAQAASSPAGPTQAVPATAGPARAVAATADREAVGATATFDSAMCRLLRVPPGPCGATDDQANRLFSASMLLSAARCLLTYIVLPLLAPLLGPATGDHPEVGIPLGVVAIIFDIRAVRRFWLAEHPWRRRITAVYAIVLVMILVLLAGNISQIA